MISAFLGLIASSGCTKWGEITAPITQQVVERGAVRFEPYDSLPEPLRYTLWHSPLRGHFALMQQCSGHTRSFDHIEWFAYPGQATFSVGAKRYAGFWDGDRRIYLAGTPTTLSPPQASDIPYTLIRHELLHYLTKSGDHPPEYFGASGRCAVELGLR